MKKVNPEVPVATLKDIDNTITTTKGVYKIQLKTTIKERSEKLIEYIEALKEYTKEFAKLLTTK